MKSFPFFRTLLLCLVVSAVTSWVVVRATPVRTTAAQTRWAQVKERGVLRCGYFMWPPFIEREGGAGAMKGPGVQVIEKMAEELGLKVDWVSEVDLAHMFSNYDRYDMVCGPVTQNGMRARESSFTIPLGYAGIYAWVREDDHRFDGKDFSALNDENVKISIIDGEYSDLLSRELFPKAQRVALGQIGTGGQMIREVTDGKADVALTDAFSMEVFRLGNPGKIRPLSTTPVRVTNVNFPLPPNEPAFKEAIDAALQTLVVTGFIERALVPYELGLARVMPPAKLYRD